MHATLNLHYIDRIIIVLKSDLNDQEKKYYFSFSKLHGHFSYEIVHSVTLGNSFN